MSQIKLGDVVTKYNMVFQIGSWNGKRTLVN